jgi:streptogramin lyase
MNKAIAALLSTGFLLAIVFFHCAGHSGSAATAVAAAPAADLQASEALLNPEGYPLEINCDPARFLWLSDYEIGLTGQGEVWHIDPATGVYTLYHGMNTPSDARGDGDGTLWWADLDHKRIGRLAQGQEDADLWQLGGSSGLYGTALDGSGRLWVADSGQSAVHSLDPADNMLCTYEFPSSGTAGYLAAGDDALWFGDGSDQYLYRLAPEGPALTQWPLPAGAYPEGLAIDSSGALWWADPVQEALVRLDPDRDQFTTFALPAGSTPEMIAPAGERIWFSEVTLYGGVGLLDPWQASGSTQTLAGQSVPVTTTCAIHAPDLTLSLTVSQGTLGWTETAYPTTIVAPGVWAATLPGETFPWGVAADGHGTWVVDNGRRVLARLPAVPVDLRACVMEDEDGDLNTADDRTPLVDWPVSLFVNGAEQVPGQVTGTDGCYTWHDQEAGVQYSVGQTVPEEWSALTPEFHDFGVGASGGGYRYVFVNTSDKVEVFLPLVLRH